LCLALVLAMGSLGIGYAAWTDTIYIEGTVTTGIWEDGGSPGFWKNWDKHETYTQTDVQGWLSSIDGVSHWLVPDMDANGIIDISDMVAILEAGQGGTHEEKFLRHYLATRLNVEAGRLFPDTFRFFGHLDPDDYLGLGGQGTLAEIISAIEGKYDTSPTKAQFEIMKNICDAVNNLEI
jgi:hypothetical protein